MKRWVYACCLVLLAMFVPSASAAVSDSPEVPLILYRGGTPLWVAAEHAIGPSGELKPSALGPWTESVLRKARHNTLLQKREAENNKAATHAAKQPEALTGCKIYSGTVAPEHAVTTNSVAELTAKSTAVFSGTVTAVRQGFFGGLPGSLLRLSGTFDKGQGADETYLFYPFARIRTNEGLVCAHPGKNFLRPAVGDQLIVFSIFGGTHLETGEFIMQAPVSMLAHRSKTGGTTLPQPLRALTTSFSEARKIVQASLRTNTTGGAR